MRKIEAKFEKITDFRLSSLDFSPKVIVIFEIKKKNIDTHLYT